MGVAKEIKALIVTDEVVADDLEKIIQRVGAKLKKFEDQQVNVKKVDEFNALSDLMKKYDMIIRLLEMAEYMLSKP